MSETSHKKQTHFMQSLFENSKEEANIILKLYYVYINNNID